MQASCNKKFISHEGTSKEQKPWLTKIDPCGGLGDIDYKLQHMLLILLHHGNLTF